MSSASLTYKDNVTITVRPSMGSDVWDEECVYRNLGKSIEGHPMLRLNKFIEAVVRSEVIGDLGFTWPESVTDVACMVSAYEGWRQLPRDLLKQWDGLLTSVNVPPGDKDLQPISPGEALPPPQK